MISMTRILITGANRGIGLELVRQYLQRGDVMVFAGCRHPERATALLTLNNRYAYAERLYIVQLDVTDAGSIAHAAEIVGQHVNGLDLLINNAAINPKTGIQDLDCISAEEMLNILHVNTVAPVMVTRAFLRLLRRGDHPVVVNISSMMGSIANKRSGGYYGYCASKAGLNMVTRTLAADLSTDGITCVAVNPGWVQTDMGGSGAHLTPQQSVEGMLRLFDGLTPEDSGGFMQWDGRKSLPW